MTDGVLILRSYYEAAVLLPDQDRLAFYDVILSYGLNGELPADIPPHIMALFIGIKPNIDRSVSRYKAAVENGKKGGRPRKEKPNKNQTQSQTKNLNKDKDLEKDTDTESEMEKDYDYAAFLPNY